MTAAQIAQDFNLALHPVPWPAQSALTEAESALLRRAGLTLPPLPPPIGTFLPAVEAGGLLHLSGQPPLDALGRALTGKVGVAVDLPEARRRAGLAALALVAIAAAAPGRLGRVRRVVRLLGMVNAPADFREAGAVLDGASEALAGLWPLPHARTDLVLPALPGNITLEIEAVFEMAPA